MLYKKLTISALLIIGTFISCKKEEPKLPLAQKKLERILTDIHLAEAAMQYVADKKRDSLEEIYYQQVFEIHEINQDIFLQCMKILETNPKLNSIIYQNMMNDFEGRKNKITSKKRPTKKREWSQDSLSRE